MVEISTPPHAQSTDRAGSATEAFDDTLHRVLRLANSLSVPFSTYLGRRYNISINEFRLLMLIGRNPGCASHELAEITGVNPMSIFRAVSALQKHNRVKMFRDPHNKKRKPLVLTAEGQRLYEAMRPQVDKVSTYLVSGLSPEDVTRLNAYLDTLVETLHATDERGNSQFLAFTQPD